MTPQFPIEEDEGGGMLFSPWFWGWVVVAALAAVTVIAWGSA